jgi:hypothetical protein
MFDSNKTLTLMDDLCFDCNPNVPCFNTCCRNVNIFLTPADILRIRKRLDMGSAEFLDKYTIAIVSQTTGLPLVLLKMRETEAKECPFVGPEGCTIYADRPWSCRLYPLDYDTEADCYKVMADRSKCLGFEEGRVWVVEDWLAKQGVLYPKELDRYYSETTARLEFPKDKIENPQLVRMFYMASYDLDTFRRFVFESRFLKIFDISEDLVERIKTDDEELARLAFLWLKFGLSDKNALPLRPEVIAEQQQAPQP